ncbi:MAG: hypothetical protein GY705_07565 [Bacteroidetes bacterium]|nr:hypothetical protein [Bacteroidota bacterium]
MNFDFLKMMTSQKFLALTQNPLDEESPIALREDIPSKDILEVKMYRFFKLFLEELKAQQPMKLTQKGNLPRKFLHLMYDHRIYPDKFVDEGKMKILREHDFFILNKAHIICKLARLIRKYHNKLSLTKNGMKLLENDSLLYKELIKAYTNKYNWAYMSYYPEHIGQVGWGFVLYNFIRKGGRERPSRYYADQYLSLYPNLLDAFPERGFTTKEKDFYSCFRQRFFENFCSDFGLVDVRVEKDESGHFAKEWHVKKSSFLGKVFVIK